MLPTDSYGPRTLPHPQRGMWSFGPVGFSSRAEFMTAMRVPHSMWAAKAERNSGSAGKSTSSALS